MMNSHASRPARSRRMACVAGLALAAVLAAAGLSGCSTDTVSTSSSAASSEADGTATAAASASSEAADTAAIYSAHLTDNGTWEGVTASDYVTLPADWNSLTIPLSEVASTDDAIQTQIDSILSSFSSTEQVTDRAVADGDTVNIDYVGSIDGVEFDGGSTGGAGTDVTIGVTQYIDDFLEQLIGHTPGENFDIEVTFPDNYASTDLAGKDATFNITINYISETSTPELTDEWVAENLQSMMGWTTVEEVRQYVIDSLQSTNISTYVQDYLVNNATVSEVPQEMIDYNEGTLRAQFATYAESMGTDVDSMAASLLGTEGATMDDVVASYQQTFEDTARTYLVYQAAAEAAGIEITDDDVATYFTDYMGTSDYSSYEAAYGMPYLKLVVLIQQVNDLLVNNATVVDDTAGASSSGSDAAASSAPSAAGDLSAASTDGEVGGGSKGSVATPASSAADAQASSASAAADASAASE